MISSLYSGLGVFQMKSVWFRRQICPQINVPRHLTRVSYVVTVAYVRVCQGRVRDGNSNICFMYYVSRLHQSIYPETQRWTITETKPTLSVPKYFMCGQYCDGHYWVQIGSKKPQTPTVHQRCTDKICFPIMSNNWLELQIWS